MIPQSLGPTAFPDLVPGERFQRAVVVQEMALGPQHPALAETLEGYATLLRETNRLGEAEKVEARVQAILAGRGHQAPTN